jgi:nucleoside-diphosphate-sugar epimerase
MKQNTMRATPRKKAFVTGGLGNVGEWVLRELTALGFDVACFDLQSPGNVKKAKQLGKDIRFQILWGDLTSGASVEAALDASMPDVIVHVAAIIPPLSVRNPSLAHKVNVGGTQTLLKCGQARGIERFIFVSSYSVLGPCNPHRDPPMWTSATVPNPQDDYAKQKVEAEALVKASGLDFTIVRLCAVFPLGMSATPADMMRFNFLLPYDRREQGIDVRDAALAIAKAAQVPAALGRTFVVGGPQGWQRTGGELSGAAMASAGIRPFPRDAYRLPDPNVDESWYFENFVDTSESQAVLGYQRYAFTDYLAESRRRMGFVRFIMPLIAGGARASFLKHSPYLGKTQTPDPTPFAEVEHSAFAKSDA